MKRLTTSFCMGAAFWLTGCLSPDKYSEPEMASPQAWTNPSLAVPAPYWNTILADKQLDSLIAEALVNNSDLRIAAERVELARAQFRIQRSEQLPGVNGGGSFERQRSQAGITETWGALLSVPSWEIDLWGRVAALSESAQQRFLASEFNRRAVEVSLTSQVATSYLNLVSLDRQVGIAESTLKSRRDSQTIIEDRREAGITSGLDLRQAVILTYSAAQMLAELERLQARQENALSILLGRGPGAIQRSDTLFDTVVPARLPADLPSALLTQRPDIQSAEAQLSAAQLDVYAARKTFLPAFSITGYAGFISGEFSDLFDDETKAWNIAPAAALPLFNSGRLRANLQANEAARSIASETYVFSVRNAYREVENALIDHQSFIKQVESSNQIIKASRERLELTDKRYREGVSTYFEVLDASRELFNNELAYVRNYDSSLSSVIELYRALAADWMPEPEAAAVVRSSKTKRGLLGL
jgi:multidrug efflux system outer membrane protein